MPDAVTVATVAEPVATRINTATSQARNSTGRLLPLIASAITPAIPVSIRTCLKPPPAPTINKMPAMGGRELSSDFEMALRSIPPPRPSSTIPTRTARPKATTVFRGSRGRTWGVPRNRVRSRLQMPCPA